MKNITLTTCSTLIVMSSIAYAGGDIRPITVFEQEPVMVPMEVPMEVFVPAPIPVAPVAPVAIPKPIAVIPTPVTIKEIMPLGLYVGLGLSAARFDPNCGCKTAKGDSDKTAGFIGRVGYDFNEYIGLEARGIRTNWKSNGGKIKHAGLFVKPMYPVSEDINVYGLAGYAKTTTQGSKRSFKSPI
jgi:hypothetical protein